MHELPPLVHPERGTVVDLHHTILPPTSRLKPDPAKLWSAAQPLGTGPLHVLAPPDMVLHSAAHLFHDGDLRLSLRDLVDIADLLGQFERSERDFWPRLVSRAAELNLGRPCSMRSAIAAVCSASPSPRHFERGGKVCSAAPDHRGHGPAGAARSCLVARRRRGSQRCHAALHPLTLATHAAVVARPSPDASDTSPVPRQPTVTLAVTSSAVADAIRAPATPCIAPRPHRARPGANWVRDDHPSPKARTAKCRRTVAPARTRRRWSE